MQNAVKYRVEKNKDSAQNLVKICHPYLFDPWNIMDGSIVIMGLISKFADF